MTATELDADPVIAEHRMWLSVWCDLTRIASGGFTPQGRQLPMTEEQRDAARAIPDVLDRLEEAWALMDESARPLHYLMSV
jgi:hypothetical protein